MLKLKRKKRFDQTAEITSLIDIVFILLIFFLLTAVFLPQGVPLDLPEASQTHEADTDSFLISIQKDGKILIGDEEASFENLKNQISNLDFKKSISISADQKADYGIFIKVIDLIKTHGDHPIILSAEPVQNQ